VLLIKAVYFMVVAFFFVSWQQTDSFHSPESHMRN